MRSNTDPKVVLERFKIEPLEWVSILSKYSARERLLVALPLLFERHGHLRFRQIDLAELICASREKVSVSMAKLRREGVLSGGGPLKQPWVLTGKEAQ